jgi:translocation and assembly module TamB
VFGNTVVRAAGVRIGGTARRPDVEAFTVPYTTRERAWGVLITGSDVQFGQGVGALDVGTYIAPRIFLSYGISFFDNDNVVGIRYDLPRRGWGVKATSGQRESGVDLSYTIEVGRDEGGEENSDDQ